MPKLCPKCDERFHKKPRLTQSVCGIPGWLCNGQAYKKAAPVRYACSCTLCGWQGRRTLETLNQLRGCPKCHKSNVFPNNPRMRKLL